MPHTRPTTRALGAGALLAGAILVGSAGPASAVDVSSEAELRAAFADAAETTIVVTADIDLTDCVAGDVTRPDGAAALSLSGAFEIHQTCPDERVLGSGAAATGSLTIDGLTISGGRLTDAVSATGGGIFWLGDLTLHGVTITDNSATAPFGGLGGGVFTNGNLVLTDSLFTGNTAGSSGTFGGLAGALSAGGTATITDSTLAGNTAEGGATFGGTGGAFFGNGNVILIGSTVSGNQALASDDDASGGNGGGAAINGSLELYNTTVSGNSATGSTSNNGGVAAGDDTTLVYSTIVGNSAATAANVQSLNDDPTFGVDTLFATVIADPLGGGTNCGPSSGAVSEGYSFADDTSCNLTAIGDQQGTAAPDLGALADNGVPTLTHLPAAGSPLLNAIPTASCEAGSGSGVGDDQRGITRPQGVGCDIGAVEVTVPPVDPTDPTTPTPAGAQPVVANPIFAG